ncbi:heparan-alpha-glucosaminide N-acetyltransferase [Pseudoalteromonas sp. XMcav1-K]|uniref:heparan-alpha-glucosaminide N-acetyltransferase n=1 Tax=Pseudoalteromonas sp. XMcav1-K TaxID=3374372 RepID=UPI0037563A62
MALKRRNNYIDSMRATAIILMVAFHFVWDLNHFGYVTTDIPNGIFWKEFRALIVSLFLFSVGASLVYSYQGGISAKKLSCRMVKITSAALLVTLSSLFTLPEHWIYFGILHFIAVATLLLVWLVDKPKLSLLLSIFIFGAYLAIEIPWNWPFNYFEYYVSKHPSDLVTLFPWLALPLLGIWAAHFKSFGIPSANQYQMPSFVTLLSRHSLLIYLFHQPLLFSGFRAIEWVA